MTGKQNAVRLQELYRKHEALGLSSHDAMRAAIKEYNEEADLEKMSSYEEGFLLKIAETEDPFAFLSRIPRHDAEADYKAIMEAKRKLAEEAYRKHLKKLSDYHLDARKKLLKWHALGDKLPKALSKIK